MVHVGKPGVISLGGGMPNPETFPFSGIKVELKSGDTIELTPQEVSQALQYSATPGLPELVRRLSNMQLAEHSPPAAAKGFQLSITVGSQVPPRDTCTGCC